MDSMRSLNTSLPRSHSRRRAGRSTHTGEVLQAFRTAALSVTQLYKSALADQQKARTAGYEEAIEDLLNFLDNENLGVGDGEGWRIRQWATERASPTSFARGDDSDGETSPAPRSASAEREDHPTSSPEPAVAPASASQLDPAPASAGLAESTIPAANHTPIAIQTTHPDMFSFQAGPQISFQPSMDVDAMPPRAQRSSHRGPSLGGGAGLKRKQNLADFFDLGSITSKDYNLSGGPSKRNRHA